MGGVCPDISFTLADYPGSLPNSPPVERSLSGILFLVAAVAISIGAGAWWLQRVAFTPDATRDSAAAILELQIKYSHCAASIA